MPVNGVPSFAEWARTTWRDNSTEERRPAQSTTKQNKRRRVQAAAKDRAACMMARYAPLVSSVFGSSHLSLKLRMNLAESLLFSILWFGVDSIDSQVDPFLDGSRPEPAAPISNTRALNKFNATRIVRTTNLNMFSTRIDSRSESLNITSNVCLRRRRRR